MIWRWHFYAGLFCIPFILTLAISGSIYLFKPQIDVWTDRAVNNLDVIGVRTTAQQQIDAALTAYPQANFVSYRLPENDRQAIVITLQWDQVKHGIYINPYTLAVIKDVELDQQFIRLIRSFHGELLLGTTGAILIELAGSWAIVMVITGMYLWWPRSTKGLAGIIYPRLSQGNRLFWRDLHAVTGFWVALFTLFLLISGLPWALIWGSAFKELRSIGKPTLQQDWTISGTQHHHGGTSSADANIILTETLLKKMAGLNYAAPTEVSLAKGNTHQWHLASQHQNRPLRKEAWFDMESENLIKTKSFEDKDVLDRVVGYGIAAHEGQLFGWQNQLLGLFTTIGLIAVSVSGFVLWRKCKPDGVLGAPVKNNQTVDLKIWIITLSLAVVLPVLAISLIALSLLEFTLLRRHAATKQWLGL